MKFTLIIFSLTFLINLKSSAQEIMKKDLLSTEWFVDNSQSAFEMFSINLDIGDSLFLIQRLHNNIRSDSALFGQQEFKVLGHNNYANFEFSDKSLLLYYLTTEDNPFHTIVGRMPLWKWKNKGKTKIKLYKNGKFNMTLKLVIKEVQNFDSDGSPLKTKKLIFVRIK